jgi:hypothetical protein
MKRSDMIKMMVQIQLNPPKHIREMNDGAAQIVRLIDYMLSEMEEAGMYPPDRFHQGHHISEWEPEDDLP